MQKINKAWPIYKEKKEKKKTDSEETQTLYSLVKDFKFAILNVF